NVIWSEVETSAFIQFITTNSAEGGDGLNFKTVFWPKVALHLVPLLTKGLVKSATMECWGAEYRHHEACSSKWGRLHTKYNLVKPITNLSGIPWHPDDDLGLNILDKGETVWEELIMLITAQKNPVAKSFRKKGWTHFSAMHALLGGISAKGTNV
ncbi:hypothetical protein SERLA73DRAFT_28815, partial [Serpula lacrymans var. lacrymans S7.3]